MEKQMQEQDRFILYSLELSINDVHSIITNIITLRDKVIDIKEYKELVSKLKYFSRILNNELASLFGIMRSYKEEIEGVDERINSLDTLYIRFNISYDELFNEIDVVKAKSYMRNILEKILEKIDDYLLNHLFNYRDTINWVLSLEMKLKMLNINDDTLPKIIQ